MRKRLTTEEFVKRAKDVHGDKYIYNKTEYLNTRSKVDIICKGHGEFKQNPNSHLCGKGCSKCAGNFKLTTKEFIIKAKKVHMEEYDYSKTKYRDSHTKVLIICKKHGKFSQEPYNHLNGHGCLRCSIEKESLRKLKSTNIFIQDAIKAHGNKYDYSKVEYEKSDVKVIIGCKFHGEFKQTPTCHLAGSGCRSCGYDIMKLKNTSNKEEFIKKSRKIHGDKYCYDKVRYERGDIKVKIKCSSHGYFTQTPFIHLAKAGCPYCYNKNEGEVKDLLLKYFEDWSIISHRKIWDSYLDYDHRRYCDFWLEKDGKKVVVEYDGRQHFEPVCFNGISFKKAEKEFERTQIKDQLDTKFCKENNITLHRIKYDEDKEESIKKLRIGV